MSMVPYRHARFWFKGSMCIKNGDVKVFGFVQRELGGPGKKLLMEYCSDVALVYYDVPT